MKRIACLALLSVLGCAAEEEGAYTEHETPEDFELVEKSGVVSGVPSRFEYNRVLEDAFFVDGDAVTAAQVQAFLERNPYGRRSFLADERVNGERASAAIVRASQAKGINPVVMLARMQVEKSLVAKTSRPSSHAVDYAFGCGCPDNRPCNTAYRGLDKQIECAAHTLRRHYDGSQTGVAPYNKGRARNSLDGYRVVASNHATASLYSYTPWVLEGRGGNWLVWNITLKYARHFQQMGVVPGDGGDDLEPPRREAWVGTPCASDDDCDFASGARGSCQRFPGGGMCTLSCDGFCPDRDGFATTFCVSSEAFGETEVFGLCTAKAESRNGHCSALPGMVRAPEPRYIGTSSAPNRTAEVCVPAQAIVEEAPAPPVDEPVEEAPEEEEIPRAQPIEDAPDDPCEGLDYLGECRGDVAVWCDNGRLAARDCAAEGATCGYIDDRLGWYCR